MSTDPSIPKIKSTDLGKKAAKTPYAPLLKNLGIFSESDSDKIYSEIASYLDQPYTALVTEDKVTSTIFFCFLI